jgi:uncharacterized membrane protein YagU involved in acid resistance
MASALFDGLGTISATAFRWSLLAFVIMNGFAIAAVVLTKDRSLVNRWTSRLLGANLLLAATGLGIPLVATVSRLAVALAVPSATQAIPRVVTGDEAPQSLVAPQR